MGMFGKMGKESKEGKIRGEVQSIAHWECEYWCIMGDQRGEGEVTKNILQK